MTEPHAGKPDRTWLLVGLAFVVFWGIYLAFFVPKTAREAPLQFKPDANLGQAEYGWRVFDLDGKAVEFSRFKGQAVFLNVWATWCGPCVMEMPSIAKLAADPRLKGVAFVCVSTDDDAATVTRFLARHKDWPMTVLRATDVPPVFTTEFIPATFLITPDGRIAASQEGSTDWNTPEVVAFLETLAKKP